MWMLDIEAVMERFYFENILLLCGAVANISFSLFNV